MLVSAGLRWEGAGRGWCPDGWGAALSHPEASGTAFTGSGFSLVSVVVTVRRPHSGTMSDAGSEARGQGIWSRALTLRPPPLRRPRPCPQLSCSLCENLSRPRPASLPARGPGRRCCRPSLRPLLSATVSVSDKSRGRTRTGRPTSRSCRGRCEAPGPARGGGGGGGGPPSCERLRGVTACLAPGDVSFSRGERGQYPPRSAVRPQTEG